VGGCTRHFVEIAHTWANHPPSQPMIAAQLLGQPAMIEPYTILIMELPLSSLMSADAVEFGQ
jgi:hypothetical protein